MFDRPGPGNYEVNTLLPEGPAYTMGRKPPERKAADDGPAVGEYDVTSSAGMGLQCPAWTLGARRDAPENRETAELPGQ